MYIYIYIYIYRTISTCCSIIVRGGCFLERDLRQATAAAGFTAVCYLTASTCCMSGVLSPHSVHKIHVNVLYRVHCISCLATWIVHGSTVVHCCSIECATHRVMMRFTCCGRTHIVRMYICLCVHASAYIVASPCPTLLPAKLYRADRSKDICSKRVS